MNTVPGKPSAPGIPKFRLSINWKYNLKVWNHYLGYLIKKNYLGLQQRLVDRVRPEME